jgi:hypothetical protein
VQFFIVWSTSFRNLSFIILYGASLCALHKKDGGIRPIAIGNCLRRLTSKQAYFQSRNIINSYLSPHQLGVATKLGCEAAIHTTQTFFFFFLMRSPRALYSDKAPNWALGTINKCRQFRNISRYNSRWRQYLPA